MNKKFRNTVDLCMFLLLILLLVTSAGSIAFHEVTGLLFALLMISHLSLNIKWIKNSIKNLLAGKLNGKSRSLFILDTALCISFIAAIIFGFMQSQAIFPSVNTSKTVHLVHMIHRLHTISAIVSLILTILHIRMHWKYVKSLF